MATLLSTIALSALISAMTVLFSGVVAPDASGPSADKSQKKVEIRQKLNKREALPSSSMQFEMEGTSDSVNRPTLEIHDSMRTTYKFTDGLKQLTINRDTAQAIKLFEETLALDSTYAPALFQLAQISFFNSEMRGEELNPKYEDYARRAYLTDTMSRWYAGIYGHSLIINRKLDEALDIYKHLLKIDPRNSDNYRILSIIYQYRNQPYSAISVIDSADVRFGKLPQLQDLRQHLLLSTRQYDRAIDEAKQVVDQAPYDQSAVLTLGRTYIEAGRDSLADATLRHAFEMDSTNIDVLTTYADFKYRKHQTEEYMRLLHILFSLKEFPEANKKSVLERFMSNRSFYSEYYYYIGHLITAMSMLNPNDKYIVNLYGEHLLAGGFLDSSIEYFKAHLDDKPAQIDYYMAVIDLEEYRNMKDSVDHYVQRAVELFPDNPDLYLRKANRQYIKSDLHGAVETFKQALTKAQNDTLRGEIWGYIGDTYHQISERAALKKAGADTLSTYPVKMSQKAAIKQCFASYDKALALYADNSMVLNNYAYFLIQVDDSPEVLERALQMSARALEFDKNNSSNLDTYAWILFKLGRLEEAQTYMRQALSLDTTKSPELNLHYGDVLFALGKEFLAKTYWRKALELGADPAAIEERINKLKKN